MNLYFQASSVNMNIWNTIYFSFRSPLQCVKGMCLSSIKIYCTSLSHSYNSTVLCYNATDRLFPKKFQVVYNLFLFVFSLCPLAKCHYRKHGHKVAGMGSAFCHSTFQARGWCFSGWLTTQVFRHRVMAFVPFTTRVCFCVE